MWRGPVGLGANLTHTFWDIVCYLAKVGSNPPELILYGTKLVYYYILILYIYFCN